MIDGAKFRAGREARGLTIEQAADYLGLEPHVYAGLEKGTRTLSPRQAARALEGMMKLRALGAPGASRPPMPTAEAAEPVSG